MSGVIVLLEFTQANTPRLRGYPDGSAIPPGFYCAQFAQDAAAPISRQRSDLKSMIELGPPGVNLIVPVIGTPTKLPKNEAELELMAQHKAGVKRAKAATAKVQLGPAPAPGAGGGGGGKRGDPNRPSNISPYTGGRTTKEFGLAE
jgi:hypothetical protein